MSALKQIRREKSGNKDTRWDRIRKRNANSMSISLKSDAVRRFIEMDFIGRHNERLLNGDKNVKLELDPVLVMDLRHEMFQKIPRKLPLATVANQNNLDSCIAHNMAVEEHYIANELNKFRQQLEKNHKRTKIKLKAEHTHTLELDNTALMQSLETTSKHIEDFYAAPLEALQEGEDLCNYSINISMEQWTKDNAVSDTEYESNSCELDLVTESEGKTTACECNEDNEEHMAIPAPITEVKLIPTLVATEHRHHMRCVRFEEDVELRNYQRENSLCSNTSDGIDSVISDLAEEALMELRLEEEAKADEQAQSEANKEDERRQSPRCMHVEGASVGKTEEPKDLLIVQRVELSQIANKRKKATVVVSSTDSEDEPSTSVHEQEAIIEKLFQSRAHTNVMILRSYLLRWIHYTTMEKIERDSSNVKTDRVHKINTFLDKLRKEKVRLTKCRKTGDSDTVEGVRNATQKPQPGTVQITKKYQNKIKIQQDIIDLQRVKLERQERLIMELKLNKISEASKGAREDIKNELKTVLRSGDPKAKAKAKCLQLIGNLRDSEDDDFARLQGRALLVPKFLQNMQERALERDIKHEQARQRRLQKEAEREAQKIAAEDAKRQQDEEAKLMRIQALKEKRRQEKMAKIRKERDRQRAIANNQKAHDFCRRLLLRRVGLEGFRRLVAIKHENQRKCINFRRTIFKRTYFLVWHEYYRLMLQRKALRADECYEKKLKRKVLDVWKKYVANERSKYNTAMDWFDLKLTESVFSLWYTYTHSMKLIEKSKMRKAKAHHEWHLKWKVVDCWRRLPQILVLDREMEERRERWRLKIWELLPDYKPNRDDFLLN